MFSLHYLGGALSGGSLGLGAGLPMRGVPVQPVFPLADDDGREVREQHLGPAEERHPGDPEEEQQRPELRGAVPERLHHGAAQARGEAVHGPAGGRHRAPRQQGERRTPPSIRDES